jgi:hypothetical protein
MSTGHQAIYIFSRMTLNQKKNSQTRLIVASSLFLLSVLASFLISYTARLGDHYWVTTQPLAKGVQISQGDLALVKATIPRKMTAYLQSETNPIGSITTRNIPANNLLSKADVSGDSALLRTHEISLAVRAVDIPITINPGELISLYQVIDSRSGEPSVEPTQIISGVFLRDVARKSANFASDVSITISLDQSDIPIVLAATSIGRIVVAATHG